MPTDHVKMTYTDATEPNSPKLPNCRDGGAEGSWVSESSAEDETNEWQKRPESERFHPVEGKPHIAVIFTQDAETIEGSPQQGGDISDPDEEVSHSVEDVNKLIKKKIIRKIVKSLNKLVKEKVIRKSLEEYILKNEQPALTEYDDHTELYIQQPSTTDMR